MGLNKDGQLKLEKARAAYRAALEQLKKLEEDKPITEDLRDALQEAHDDLGGLLQQLEALPAAQNTSITTFFDTVGRGLVDAQRQLDEESLAYNAARLPSAAASVYRIPRVSAEISFALEQSSRRELNLLVYGRSEKATKLHQNKVNFEIVSVPPSADSAASIEQTGSLSTLVILLDEREAIRRAMLAAAERVADSVAEKLREFAHETGFDARLLLRYREAGVDGALGEERIALVRVDTRPSANGKHLEVELDAISIPDVLAKPFDAADFGVEDVLGAKSGKFEADKLGRAGWFMGQVLLGLSKRQATLLERMRLARASVS